jgi:UPF0755 protein
VSDRRQRSAQEREAARLDRERKRAGLPEPPPVQPPPVEPPVAAPVPRPVDPAARERQPEAAAVSSRPPIKSFPSEPDPDPYEPGEFDDGEHPEREPPSGTRRVSLLETSAGARKGKPRAAKRRRPPSAKRARHRWIGRLSSVLALLLAGALIWFLFELFQPLSSSPHGSVTVKIPSRSSASQIGKQLAGDGVISSAFFFEARATLAGERSDLRSGTYRFQLGMSYGSVLTALTKAPAAAKVSELTIAEGHTRQYVSKLLRDQKIKGNYLAATRRSPLLDPRRYGARHQPPSLEGFLFPDTFKLVAPVKISALVADQLRDFKQRFATVKLGYARSRHQTPYDVLKIASLIEAEAASSGARPLIASVIYNRLADRMMLQFDSTTRYATGNFTRPLKVSQLRSSSPYNTHTHFGLPPTPIDSPGLASIQAAARPARTRYLYFFSKPCTTGSVFATSYAQFLNLLQRDRRTHC